MPREAGGKGGGIGIAGPHGIVEQLDSRGIKAAISRRRAPRNVMFQRIASPQLIHARCCLRLRGLAGSAELSLRILARSLDGCFHLVLLGQLAIPPAGLVNPAIRSPAESHQ